MTGGNGNGADPVTVAELAVLGTAVTSIDGARDALAAQLEARHFRHPLHREVFAAVLRLAGAPEPAVDPTAVLADLCRAGVLAGDAGAFIADLPGYAGPVAHHAPHVLAAWQRRNLRGTLAAAADLTESDRYDPARTPGQVHDLITAATAVQGATRLRPHYELLEEVYAAVHSGPPRSLSTGYDELDALTGGLRPREMVVIAARPAVGKTLLGLCIADHIATELDLPVLFSSLEMSAAMLTLRRISARAEVPFGRLLRHELTPVDDARIADAWGDLSATQLAIDEGSPAGMPQFRGRLTEMARAKAPAVAHLLDYIGLATTPPAESRQQGVAALARGHRQIAIDYDLPVVTLCQLNRNLEGRKDRRPRLSDLRESGELEQAADQVWLLHREGAESPDGGSNELEVIVAKNRNGPQGTVKLRLEGHYGRVVSAGHALWSPAGAFTHL